MCVIVHKYKDTDIYAQVRDSLLVVVFFFYMGVLPVYCVMQSLWKPEARRQ